MADLNLNQAAELLGLSPQRLEELAGTGDIHATKSDDGYTFSQDEVERFADMNGITLGSGADGDEYNLADDGDTLTLFLSTKPLFLPLVVEAALLSEPKVATVLTTVTSNCQTH